MCKWLIEQFILYPKTVFSFTCSTAPLETNHGFLQPEKYRWSLFECLYQRIRPTLQEIGINSNDIVIGPEYYQTDARVFYRNRHAPIVHIVESHLKDKYEE